MSFKKVTILFALAFIFQLTIVNIFSINSTGPNLVFCLMVIITFLYEDGYRSIPFGMFFGFLLDICSGAYVGITPLAMLIAGIFAAAGRIWLNVEKIYTLLTTGIIATILYQATYYAVMKALGDPMGIVKVLAFQPLLVAYNTLILAIMFITMHKSAEKYHNDRYSE